MTTKVCPQRIIKEAIRIMERDCFAEPQGEGAQDAMYTIEELKGLEKSLFRGGIHNIVEWEGLLT